jgi:UDP-N-acetylmuramoyl-L-alanyl-D-glutamate--2,6-diaminopimelate ligase
MKFSDLLPQQIKVENDFQVTNVTDDSRIVSDGDVFVFDKHIVPHGEKFIQDALNKGAQAVISNIKQEGVTYAENPTECLIAWAKHQHSKMPEHIVGVTGTNGKTSVVWFYRQIMSALGKKAATMGTLGVYTEKGKLADTGYTSPTPLVLHQHLDALAGDKVTHLALEVSSHGLALHRVDGVPFKVAAFTNLSPDHRDFHGTMEAYAAAKYRLFSELLVEGGTAVLHITQEACWPLAALCKGRELNIITYGANNAELVVRPTALQSGGMTIELLYGEERYTADVPLVGAFQAENIAAAVGLAIGSGASFKEVADAVSGISSVPGRMEIITTSSIAQPTVIVDYAHTPDALENAITSLKPQIKGKLWTIFGCGGDRDTAKRPQMGKIAEQYSDVVIVTDDNPRTEDAGKIRADVLAVCKNAKEIANREEAIAYAIRHAAVEDTVLIAGKGHETGQIIGKEVVPFDDREIARSLLQDAA